MAKRKRKDRSEEAEVPIAAMIDVVFLLLIYFIVTSKEIVDEAWVSVNLPGPPPPTQVEIEPPPVIDVFVRALINRKGQSQSPYVYQGQDKNLDSIAVTLEAIGSAMGSEVSINVKVTTDSTHSQLVLLLDRMSKAGLENFNIHTLKDAYN